MLQVDLGEVSEGKRRVEEARQGLAAELGIVNARLYDFQALAERLIELDRETLPIDVKSLIAEARLAVSR